MIIKINGNNKNNNTNNNTNIVKSPLQQQQPEKQILVLEDDFVLFKHHLSLAEQQRIVDLIFPFGLGQQRDYTGSWFLHTPKEISQILTSSPSSSSSSSGLNLNLKHRARLKMKMDIFPEELTKMCADYVSLAQKQPRCRGIEKMVPIFVTLNYYNVTGHLGWHVDRVNGLTEEQQLKQTQPIVAFSVGLAAEFSYKEYPPKNKSDVVKTVLVESGDVMVFGGKSRNMLHAVHKMLSNSVPIGLQLPIEGRLNVTFRSQIVEKKLGAYYVTRKIK